MLVANFSVNSDKVLPALCKQKAYCFHELSGLLTMPEQLLNSFW